MTRETRAQNEDIVVTAVDSETKTMIVENRKDDETSRYVVDLDGTPLEAVECTCPDHTNRGVTCKHQIAANAWLTDDNAFDDFFTGQ